MTSGRNIVYGFLTYFLALNGLSRYYFDLRTGHWQKSRLLKYYAILQNLILFCGILLKMFMARVRKSSVPATNMLLFMGVGHKCELIGLYLCCIYSTHFQHYRMLKIAKELQRIKHFLSRISSRTERRSECIYIYGNLLLIIAHSFILQSIDCHSIRNYSLIDFLYLEWKVSCNALLAASYMLSFYILRNIWQCCCQLNQCIEQLLSQKRKKSIQYQQLYQLYRMQQLLINTTRDFCSIFNNIITYFKMRAAWHCTLTGYYIVRIYYGHPPQQVAFKDLFMIPILIVNCMLIFYTLGSLTGNMAGVLHETIYTLRRSALNQSQLVERTNSWLALQLTWQSTEVHIFGIIPINRQLVISFFAQMLLYLIYMIQEDYFKIWL